MAKKLQLPEGLKDETYQFINTVQKEMKKIDKPIDTDNYILRILASSFNTYLICEDLMAQYGLMQEINGVWKNMPFVEVQRKQRAQTIDILDRLGLTLKQRTKIKDNISDDEESPLMSFINGQ